MLNEEDKTTKVLTGLEDQFSLLRAWHQMNKLCQGMLEKNVPDSGGPPPMWSTKNQDRFVQPL